MTNFIKIIVVFLVFSSELTWSQTKNKEKDSTYTPYELLTSYYTNTFKPFQKKNIYVGLSLALEDRQSENINVLVGTILDGDRTKYDINLKSGYYIGNYVMAGVNFNYFQDKFSGLTLKDSDSIQSNSLTRSYAVTPNLRSSVPLTENERLSFFTDIGLTFGGGNTVTKDVKNIDEVDKSYTKNFNFRVGISPGVTFFVMENFAFEIQLDLLGYELNSSKTTVNDIDQSSKTRQNIDLNIDILSMQLGLAYYFRN
ncbi:hypothetical protein [Xanthomarina spongicola]|uniref:Outer membrane protein with beta-barrel domain n=1 Tax=Xanthomarina spongicola TaxID=570520 RepID=A0A316DR61_9FLAO|nr:hypothetical protein [Xanthomarina spongicola]PWK19659.1 hypothetical protein LX78_01008 [Xanthomarina spongicola]